MRSYASLVLGGVLAVAAVQVVLTVDSASAQSTSLTDSISDVRFGDHGTFERAVLDISTAASSPLAPPFSWSYKDGDRIVRVKLPTVGDTIKTDGGGLGKTISKYYVVRNPDNTGSLYVDFHLKEAAASVNVFKLDNPGRVIVDVTPGGTALYPKPATSSIAVITQPRANKLVGSGTFTVKGYARPLEAQGDWRVKNSSGQVVSQGVYTTNDWTAAWGAYSFLASYPASLGGQRGKLEVGELSPHDGSFAGASVPVKFK